MALTTFGDIGSRTAAYAAAKMLEHAEPILVLSKFADNKPMPKNKTQTVKFRRPIPFSINTTPLVEGVAPTAHKMSYEDVTMTLAQYGDVASITDVIQDVSEDPVLADMSMLSGEQAAETVEMLLYGSMKGGTSVVYGAAADTLRSHVNDPVSANRLRAISRQLKAARARKITSILSGSVNYGTSPIEAAWVAFAHTDLEHDIRSLSGFVPVAEYGSRQALCAEELGSFEDFRFITSPLLAPFADSGGTPTNVLSTSGSAADVYPVLIVAKNSYGNVPLKGANSIMPTVLNPGVPRGGDPLGQQGTVGWKTWWAGGILNELWMVRYEVAASSI